MITSPKRPKEPNQKPQPRAFSRSNPSIFSHKFTELQLQEMREIHNQKSLEWNSEHVDSTRNVYDKDDLLQADEVSENQEDVGLNKLVIEAFADPMAKYADLETVKDSLKPESSTTLAQPAKKAKKRTKDTAPPDRKGKDLKCCWCGMPTYGKTTQPCWNDILEGSLCQQCSMLLSNKHHLPICRAQILHLDIPCGFCGSLYGPDWRWLGEFGLPACSDECSASIEHHAKRPESRRQVHHELYRFQDQVPEKLRMSEGLKQYFKDEFDLDTSREGLRAMMAERNSLAEPYLQERV